MDGVILMESSAVRDVETYQTRCYHTDMTELMKVVLNLLKSLTHSAAQRTGPVFKSGLFCVSRINVGMLDVSSCCTVTVQI